MSFGAFADCLGFEHGRRWPSVKRLLFPFRNLQTLTLYLKDDTGLIFALSFCPKKTVCFVLYLKLAPLALRRLSDWLNAAASTYRWAEKCSSRHSTVLRCSKGDGGGGDASWQELRGALPPNRTVHS